ncbi:MAG: WYL domain-containing protein [Bradymonadales bacterium]|nr:WYL domain-containing protein [Bradymonadales bacterium]
MQRSSDTSLRQWTMLRLVPRAPRKIDTASLERRLAEQGFSIDRRSIQRDLQKLSSVFPLQCDDRNRPYGWSWMREAPAFDIPAMDAQTALTVRLIADYLTPILPPSTMAYLTPQIRRADDLLAHLSANRLSSWPEKVRVMHKGQPLLPPKVDARVLDQVYTALLEEVCFETNYRKRGSGEDRHYQVNPLGLVVRGETFYLVATLWNYDDVINLVLHRMRSVELTDKPRRIPEGFDLDRYIASGALGFKLAEQPIRLEALVDRDLQEVLHETPISEDQELVEQENGRWLLRATVADTLQLRGWILYYGSMIEVVAPDELRRELAEEVRSTADRYGV